MTQTKAPAIHPIQDLSLPNYERHTLSNGIPVYSYSAGTQEVLKIECVLLAGKSYEKQHLVAKTTAALLTEGTNALSSAQLAEKVDFYGAVITARGGVDTVRARLFCMNKNLPHVLPYLYEIIYEPTFPQEELDFFKEERKERLEYDLTKNENLGYRALTENIFGPEHPYGYNTRFEDLENLSQEALVAHHRDHYRTDNVLIFVSGKLKPDTIDYLDRYLGQHQMQGESHSGTYNIITTPERYIRMAGPQKHQAAIRIGRPLFDRKHPDFPAMYVTNALLGGYFGSRLMTNLREDKGLTYGIYSSVDTFRRGGLFYISGEVSTDKTKESLTEIYREIERMQNELVAADELQMVQNYLMGYLMSQMDGPFNIMDMIKSLLLEAEDTSYFESLTQKIRTISPQDIQQMARKYFQKQDLIEILVTT